MPAEHNTRKFISNLYFGGIVMAEYHINLSGESLYYVHKRMRYVHSCPDPFANSRTFILRWASNAFSHNALSSRRHNDDGGPAAIRIRLMCTTTPANMAVGECVLT